MLKKNGNRKYEINSKKACHETMPAIYILMGKGESNLPATELKKHAAISVAAEKYEEEVLGLKPKNNQKTFLKP